jgi:hypothetical protein
MIILNPEQKIYNSYSGIKCEPTALAFEAVTMMFSQLER